jgi:hypothetical protein
MALNGGSLGRSITMPASQMTASGTVRMERGTQECLSRRCLTGHRSSSAGASSGLKRDQLINLLSDRGRDGHCTPQSRSRADDRCDPTIPPPRFGVTMAPKKRRHWHQP